MDKWKDEIRKKVSRGFQDRAFEMIESVTISNTAFSTVSNMRIAKNWPLRGCITFTRDADDVRFKAFLLKDTWKVRKA